MKIPKEIHTGALILKATSTKDFNVFYEAFCESFENLNKFYSPAWAKFNTTPPATEMRKYIDKVVKEFGMRESLVYSIFDRENNFIGQAELHHIDLSVPKARLGYWIRDKETGQNYATITANILTRLSFDILQCKRVEIRTEVRNVVSGKIAKKIGYEYLTIFKNNKQGKEGDFWDLEIYAALNTNNLPNLEIQYVHD